MPNAHSGNSKTVSAPPATSSDAVDSSNRPELVATSVTATIIGRPAAEYSANCTFCARVVKPERVSKKCSANRTGTPRHSKIPTTTASRPKGFATTAETSIPIPLTTKNNGIMKVKPTTSRRRVIICRAAGGVRVRRIRPAAKAPSTASKSKRAVHMIRVASRNIARRKTV